MKVGELQALLAEFPADAEVVLVDYHEPMQNLAEGDYDDYAGLPNGEFSKAEFRLRRDVITGVERVEIDRY